MPRHLVLAGAVLAAALPAPVAVAGEPPPVDAGCRDGLTRSAERPAAVPTRAAFGLRPSGRVGARLQASQRVAMSADLLDRAGRRIGGTRGRTYSCLARRETLSAIPLSAAARRLVRRTGRLEATLVLQLVNASGIRNTIRHRVVLRRSEPARDPDAYVERLRASRPFIAYVDGLRASCSTCAGTATPRLLDARTGEERDLGTSCSNGGAMLVSDLVADPAGRVAWICFRSANADLAGGQLVEVRAVDAAGEAVLVDTDRDGTGIELTGLELRDGVLEWRTPAGVQTRRLG